MTLPDSFVRMDSVEALVKDVFVYSSYLGSKSNCNSHMAPRRPSRHGTNYAETEGISLAIARSVAIFGICNLAIVVFQ
jgi:hypothetical protein